MANKKISEKIVERIEKDLLSALLNYAVPRVSSRINFQSQNRPSSLESSVLGPKFSLSDFQQLEGMILSHSERNVRISKRVRTNSFDVSHEIEISRKKTEAEVGSAIESI